jgi:PAS domain S-box-containing protein
MRYIISFVCLFVLETLLVLALLWQRAKRKIVEKSLVGQLIFETLLSDLSTTFINLPEERVVSNLQESLGRMGALLQMDRITLYEFTQDRTELSESFTWTKEGAQAGRAVIEAGQLPWWTKRTLRGEVLVTSDVNVLSDEASSEKEYLRKKDIRSVASVPLEVGGEVFGAMTFASTTRHVVWSEDLVQRLKMLAEIFSNAIGRKHAEARRRESEERFRLVANTAPVLIWMSGIDMLCTYFNQGWLDFTGRGLQTELGNGWAEGVHPADLQRCMGIYTKAFERHERFTMEYRLRRHDGEFRWVLDIGVPRFDADGSFAGFIGSAIDVTGHKEAEQSLATVSGRLIQAQEEERHRIARELHDDISQRLALLSVEVQGLVNVRPKSSLELSDRAGQLLKRTSQISSDIHALSHRLHSSKLDYMGAVSAMAGFCREVTAQTGLEIDFEHTDVPRSLSQEISLCLFRVLQEGLRNAVKYSGSRQFKVELRGMPGAVQLLIRDSGSGFDPEAAMMNGGLGLISMRERVGLVKGTISIVSESQVGTEIRVHIPVARAGAASTAQMGLLVGKGAYEISEDKDLAG